MVIVVASSSGGSISSSSGSDCSSGSSTNVLGVYIDIFLTCAYSNKMKYLTN